MSALRITAIVLAFAAPLAARQALQLEVRRVEGTAKAQRAGSNAWEALAEGSRVGSEDIVETGMQSRLVLAGPSGHLLLAAGNTRAMVSVRGRSGRGASLAALRVTLFSGGVFAVIAQPCSASVYTSGAVAELTEGVLAVAADPLNGETGVQVLCADSVVVRGVAEQRGRSLVQGQTTVVRPGASPAAGMALTDAHVAVLAGLFGDSLVRARMSACGVRARPDETGGAEAPAGTRVLADQAPPAAAARRPDTYQRLFRPNDVWGGILEDRRQHYRFYAPVVPRRPLFDNRWALALAGGAAFAGGTGYGRVTLSPSVHWRVIDAALEIEFARNQTGWAVPAFTDGVEGALDLIDHVTIGHPRDSLFVTIGRLSDYSIAEGLVVQRFSNRDPYSLFQPLALYGQAALFDLLCIDGFVADISQFTTGGLHCCLRSAGYYAGLGYYYDVNQYHALPSGDGNRFAALPDTVPPGRREEIHVCELNLGADIIYTYAFGLRLMGELAYRFKTLTDMDGYVLRAPTVTADWKGMQLSASYNQEIGRLVSGQFGWFYPTNRYRAANGGTELLTQNGTLSTERVARGFVLAYRYAPLAGLAFECEYHQDLLTREVYADTTVRSHDNYEYYTALSVNDTLVPFLQYARLSIGQVHGGIYPPGATFSSGWGLHGALAVLTRPVVANLAFEAGLEYYALDLDAACNNRVDSADRIWEFFVGVRWGFL